MITSKIFIIIIFITLSCSNNSDEIKGDTNSTKMSESKELNQKNKQAIIFNRRNEPRENAFSLLIPKGWQIEGGVFRINPLDQGGPSQSIAAKLDFTIKKDREGSVMIRWLPDVLFFDARYSPAGQMGLFPEGSNYMGMTVMNIISSDKFINRIVFPYAHPGISNPKILEKRNLSQVANNYQKRIKQSFPYLTMSYDASIVKYKYEENGKQYEEVIFSLIENWGQLGAGMWGNKETFLFRTPINEMKTWEPIISTILSSVKINLQWMIKEIKGQVERGQIVIETQKEIQRIGKEITEHRQKTNFEINNDMFLTLMQQEEYVNPYTNEIEVGTNQWKHRWVNQSGDVIYSDNEYYDPNIDIEINRTDFKKSKVRERFPK